MIDAKGNLGFVNNMHLIRIHLRENDCYLIIESNYLKSTLVLNIACDSLHLSRYVW